ncbi:MAG: hypothetical protein NXI31_25400 [bacterium]|nr:hypothetical protein [bacterium]
MLRTLLISISLIAPIAAASITPADLGNEFAIQDPKPAQRKFETASTRIATPENEQWFSELIDLNPGCTVVVVGHGIAVSKTGGLTLPAGDPPADVVFSDPVGGGR